MEKKEKKKKTEPKIIIEIIKADKEKWVDFINGVLRFSSAKKQQK